MLTKSDLIAHASTAVARTARSLADIQAHLRSPSAAALGPQHRLLIDGALDDLGRRHALLTRLYEAMIGAQEEEITACWQKFFSCYDEYLETDRDVRSRLIQDDGDPGAHRIVVSPAREKKGRVK